AVGHQGGAGGDQVHRPARENATRHGPPGRGRARAARQSDRGGGGVPGGTAAGWGLGEHGAGADRAAALLPADAGGYGLGEQIDDHLPGADRPPEAVPKCGAITTPDEVADSRVARIEFSLALGGRVASCTVTVAGCVTMQGYRTQIRSRRFMRGTAWAFATGVALWSATPVPALPPCGDPTPRFVGGKARLLWKDSATDVDDKLSYEGSMATAVSTAQLGDPVPGTPPFPFWIWDTPRDRTTPRLVYDADLPAGGTCRGKPCWRVL